MSLLQMAEKGWFCVEGVGEVSSMAGDDAGIVVAVEMEQQVED